MSAANRDGVNVTGTIPVSHYESQGEACGDLSLERVGQQGKKYSQRSFQSANNRI